MDVYMYTSETCVRRQLSVNSEFVNLLEYKKNFRNYFYASLTFLNN